MTDAELVDALDAVWISTIAVGNELDERAWKQPTDCPGWSAQDVLAHVIGIEEMILDRPAPDIEVPDAPHLTNPISVANEVWVESMRSLPGAEVLERFVEVTALRLDALRSLDEGGFGAETWTPVGPGTVRDQIPFRIFDSWVHEQDIRGAVARPGGLHGSGADVSFSRCVDTMPYVIGKQVKPPDGTVVAFELSDPLGRSFAVGIEGGRGALLDTVSDEPTTTIAATGEEFVRLACGRRDPNAALADGSVTITGDEDLGRRVVEALNFLF